MKWLTRIVAVLLLWLVIDGIAREQWAQAGAAATGVVLAYRLAIRGL